MMARKNLFDQDPTVRNSGSVYEEMDTLPWSEWQAAKYGDDGESYRPKGSKPKEAFKSYVKCADTHPALVIPGTEFKVFGGSCLSPVHEADVYVGLDGGMRFTQRQWPWKKGHEVLFKIKDYGVPESASEFKKLIKW